MVILKLRYLEDEVGIRISISHERIYVKKGKDNIVEELYVSRVFIEGGRGEVGKNLVTRERSGRLIQIRFERGNYILLLLPKESWNIVREPDTA